jgi:aspartate/glutamate racemase
MAGTSGSVDRPRIALVHALAASVEPCRAAFGRLWPEAFTVDTLDASLPAALERAGSVDEALRTRFLALGRRCVADGADAVLFTCSAFGAAIDAVAADLPVPVLKPNEAMLADAVRAGPRVALLATFAPTLVSMRPEIEAEAERHGLPLELVTVHVADALALLQRGDAAGHDDAIAAAAAAAGAGVEADVIALAQFSMARAASLVARLTGSPVLTTPDTAVAELRRRLGA